LAAVHLTHSAAYCLFCAAGRAMRAIDSDQKAGGDMELWPQLTSESNRFIGPTYACQQGRDLFVFVVTRTAVTVALGLTQLLTEMSTM
jgi:hypothetical protein